MDKCSHDAWFGGGAGARLVEECWSLDSLAAGPGLRALAWVVEESARSISLPLNVRILKLTKVGTSDEGLLSQAAAIARDKRASLLVKVREVLALAAEASAGRRELSTTASVR